MKTRIEPFVRLAAVAMPLARANVDTDQIIPARYLQKLRSENFGAFLFRDLRADADFVLNRYADKAPRILVAERNFGCGSSREHAVWALMDFGFRAVIAPSFGDIFNANALKNGLLPVVLPEAAVTTLLRDAASGVLIEIDLERQTAGGIRFEIAPFARECLLQGLDELAYTLAHTAQIDAYERNLLP